MTESLSERRALLKTHVLPKLAEPIRYSPELEAGLTQLIASVKSAGLEGLVAKRRNSRYEPVLRIGETVKRSWIIWRNVPAPGAMMAALVGVPGNDMIHNAARERS